MNDHITIGRYNIYNWKEVHFNSNESDPGIYMERQRQIDIDNIVDDMITIYPLKGKWRIHFGRNKTLFNAYLLMFPAKHILDHPSTLPAYCYPASFSKAEEAKEHIDIFLNKLEKLKVFL